MIHALNAEDLLHRGILLDELHFNEESTKNQLDDSEEKSEDIKDLVKQFVPSILIQLLINGKIDQGKISDSKYLWSKVKNERSDLVSEIFYIVSFHEEFLEVAKDSLDNGKNEVAIVLIATAIEHVLNINYRQIMKFRRFSDENITLIIKNNNFEDKIGWLMSLFFEKDLEPELRKNIRKIIEIRNAIVHYKALPFSLSDKFEDITDSHSVIKNQIESLDFDILSMPEELDEALNTQFIELNPELKLVNDMMEVMFGKTE
jgi:hypothetical protein